MQYNPVLLLGRTSESETSVILLKIPYPVSLGKDTQWAKFMKCILIHSNITPPYVKVKPPITNSYKVIFRRNE